MRGGRWGEGEQTSVCHYPCYQALSAKSVSKCYLNTFNPQKYVVCCWLWSSKLAQGSPSPRYHEPFHCWLLMTIESADTPSPSAQYLWLYFSIRCNSASSLAPSFSWQLSPGKPGAGLCQNIIKRREPGREELRTEEGWRREGNDSYPGLWLVNTDHVTCALASDWLGWLRAILATDFWGLAKSLGTTEPWLKSLNGAKLWC